MLLVFSSKIVCETFITDRTDVVQVLLNFNSLHLTYFVEGSFPFNRIKLDKSLMWSPGDIVQNWANTIVVRLLHGCLSSCLSENVFQLFDHSIDDVNFATDTGKLSASTKLERRRKEKKKKNSTGNRRESSDVAWLVASYSSHATDSRSASIILFSSRRRSRASVRGNDSIEDFQIGSRWFPERRSPSHRETSLANKFLRRFTTRKLRYFANFCVLSSTCEF